MTEERKRVVVCAAVKFNDKAGTLVCSARHFDKCMSDQIARLKQSRRLWNPKGAPEQGFIDQFGVFMGRKEAMLVARYSGQPIDFERNGHDDETLYSEGLY